MNIRVKNYSISELNKRPPIIWGAGVYGEMVYKVLNGIYGIVPKLIVDNKVTSVPWTDEVPVCTSAILKEYKNFDVIVCAAKSYEIIVEQLTKYSELNAFNCRGILHEYKKCVEEGRLDKNSYYIYGDFALDEIIECYEYYIGINNGYADKLYLDYCVLCITSYCTLKCKDCAAFIRHYDHPENYSIEYVKSVFGTFLDAIDGIRELELMGGEPFINPDIESILKWCIDQPKIHSIKIITNGTMIPNPSVLTCLSNNKIKLVIDDYGDNSWSLKELVTECKKNDIRMEIQKLQTWYKLEPFVDKKYSDEIKKGIFKRCAFRNCVGVTNSRLYHCNVAGHANTVGLLSDENSQYVEIERYSDDIKRLRSKIQEFMKLTFLEACKYCDYSSNTKVEVAEQIKARDVMRI